VIPPPRGDDLGRRCRSVLVDAPRIVSHPGDGAGGQISNITVTSYIDASYIKFVEAASTRVIPLSYDEPKDRLLEVCVLHMLASTGFYTLLFSLLAVFKNATDNPRSWFYVTTVGICKCFVVVLNYELKSITKSLRITECFLSILKTREYPSLLVWLWNLVPACLATLLAPREGMAPWLTLARSLGEDWLTVAAALE
jgi:hypothetical protein